ncbi:hypothetical protein GOODEAATRI_016318 [Goodea atripinnis]|uniref:SYO1-like TPR repeats domain-containing protein n=1 Tax=Goodea atripinnis TaxID=208336 RepID=A0ABV0P5D6_9TELE
MNSLEQAEDLKAFERRLTEYVSCLQPATGRWRMILIVVSVCTATGAWNWLIDPDTQKVTFFSSLWNHPFFTISCITLIALFFAGIHKRVLQSPSADIREFACASISRVVQQSQTIPGFLQRDAVRRLGPMLLDGSLAVRETAAGALRFRLRCCADERPEQSCGGCGQRGCEPTIVSLICHPFSESSSQAVSLFNKSGLLDVVVQCLERHPHNVELAISAAHCLHTVTEDNPELLSSTNTAVLGALEKLLLSSQPEMAHTLLRTLAAGTLWNLKTSLPAARQAQTLNAIVATLSLCLDLDSGVLIPDLRRAEEAHHRNLSPVTDAEQQAAVQPVEEEMGEEEEAPTKKNGKTLMVDTDVSDLLPRGKEELREATALLTAQQTSLEIIVNMCCSDEIPKDEEFLEAVISAMRSLLQIIASKNISQVQSTTPFGMIGNALLQVATKDSDLVVNGEALDALFDVFADGEEAETAAKIISLLPALKTLQPVFKAKVVEMSYNFIKPVCVYY